MSLVRQLYRSKCDETCHNNDLIVWRTHFDEIVAAIKDPDGLAEEASKAGLISTSVKECFTNAMFPDKALTVLLTIDSKIRENPQLLHSHVIPVLKRQPGLARVVSTLQDSLHDESIEEIDIEGKSSDSETSDCSPRQLCDQEPEEQQYIIISSGEESIMKEENHLEKENESSKLSEVDDTLLGEASAADVKKEAISLSARFRAVGEVLGLPPAELDKISKNCPCDCEEAFSQVINTWLKQLYDVSKHGRPSWKKLVDTVASEAGGRNPALAMKITDAHRVSRKRQHNSGEGDPLPKLPRIENGGPLVKFRPKLADFYSKKPEIPEGTWPPVKKTHFVNLALIKQGAINFTDDYVRQTVHGSIDDIIKDKKKIKYEDAFAQLDDGALVLMEGRPGCGKTTLMNKLSQDWEKRKILASRLFFLVHFRRFNNRTDVKLAKILRSASGNFTDNDIQQMCTHIEESSGRGVVFALDGLDEYSPESNDNLLYDLVKRECLTNAVVIVASRPAASQKFRKYATKHVEVLGFLKPQIQEYIESYFNNYPDKAQGLLRYLEHHLNVMHMCYLPLHSAMVTYLYDMEGANLPQTETEIYKHFTLWTLIRSFKKRSDDPDAPFILSDFDELSHEDKSLFDLILKLAYTATISSKQVFTFNEVKEHISGQKPMSGSGSDENSLGLIIIDRYFVKYGLDEIYTFLHLTFQEFLAGCYVSNQTEKKQAEILMAHGSKENLAEVWKFFCGIGKCSSENFSILLHQAEHVAQAVKNRSRKITVPNNLLHLHCAYESQNDWMCSQVMEKCESSITLHDHSLTPSDMTALGYVIMHSEVPIKELNITLSHLGVEGLTALVTEIGNKKLSLEKLSFNGTKIKPEMVAKFAAFLASCYSVETLNLSSSVSKSTLTDISNKIIELSSLTTLDISSNRLENSGSAVKAFIDKLPKLRTLKVHLYKDCQWYASMKKEGQLKDINVKTVIPHRFYEEETEQDLATCSELDLQKLKISDKEAEVIGERLKECTNLSKLYLWNNQIGDTGAQAIAEGCKLCHNLQEIRLDKNQTGDAGAQAIASIAESCPSLQVISLGGNQIGDTGAQAIAEGCKLCPNLQEIQLYNNQIGDAGAQAIASIAESCPSLRIINLGYNQIGVTGAQAIAEGCKSCPNLQTINLVNNRITDASVPHLVGLMETARNLKILHLDYNKFTAVGMSQVRQAIEKRNTDPTNYIQECDSLAGGVQDLDLDQSDSTVIEEKISLLSHTLEEQSKKVQDVIVDKQERESELSPEFEHTETLSSMAGVANSKSRICTFTPGAPIVSRYFHCASGIASVPFIGEVEVLVCDSFGCEYWNSDHDITLKIPKGAIPSGMTLHLEVAVALYGPFQFPNGSHPISPILWLCIQENISCALTKPFEIVLPHFINALDEGTGIQHPGITVAKADHKNYATDESGKKHYVFNRLDVAFICIKEGIQNYGILSTDHCCFYCLTANELFNPELALKAGYCFWCIEKPLSGSRDKVFLCTTFFLKTCIMALKKQYPTQNGYLIHEPIIFMFKKPEDRSEPHILVTIKDEGRHCIAAVNPPNRKINASQVMFWEQSVDRLELMHAERIYPPKVTLTLELVENRPVPICICAVGAQNELDIEIMLPLASAGNALEHRSSTNYEKKWLPTRKPELRILLKELYTKAADKWEDIGIMLKIDSRRLDALKTTVNGTAQSCLREMLKLWLKTIDPPPSWSAMADALENLGDEALASHLRENYTVIVQREAAV